MNPKKPKRPARKEIEFSATLLLKSLRDHANQLETNPHQIAPTNSFRFKPSRKSD